MEPRSPKGCHSMCNLDILYSMVDLVLDMNVQLTFSTQTRRLSTSHSAVCTDKIDNLVTLL